MDRQGMVHVLRGNQDALCFGAMRVRHGRTKEARYT